MSFETCFKGKRVLVTGAGRGIGKAIVTRLHSYGAVVYAISFNPGGLNQLEQECPGIKTIAVDLGDWLATRKALDTISEQIDILINNAGIFIEEEFLNITPEAYDKTFNVNLKAVINVSQIITKRMVDNGIHGSVVNISSIAAKHTWPRCGVYCASKSALDMITQVMALELGKYKIRVNSLNLGDVETDMAKTTIDAISLGAETEEAKQQAWNQFISKIPLGIAFIPLDQVVNAALFTASDLCFMLNGHTLVVDGGQLLA